MSSFEYSKEEITTLMDSYKSKGIKPVAMVGVYNDLKKLKPIIEKVYDENVFWISAFSADARYMGWTKAEIDEMLAITEGITEKFYQIYALILVGLNEDLED